MVKAANGATRSTIHPNIRRLNHLLPDCNLTREHPTHTRRFAARDFHTQARQARFDIGHLQDAVDLAVQPRNDFPRQRLGAEYRRPGYGLKAGQAFRYGGDVGYGR